WRLWMWQGREAVACVVVVDEVLGLLSRQLGCFRNPPAPALRPIRAGDHAADVVIVDLDCRLLCAGRSRYRNRHRGDADCTNSRKQNFPQTHLALPEMPGFRLPVVKQ